MGEANAFLIGAASAALATAFAIGVWAFRKRALRRQREAYEKALAARDRRIYDLKAQLELVRDLADLRLAERYAAAKRGLEAHIAALEEERDAWTREQAAIEKRLGEIANPPPPPAAPASTAQPTSATPDLDALHADGRAVALEISRLRAVAWKGSGPGAGQR
jgi:flagellar motility protein MotE (MotC chaperone)